MASREEGLRPKGEDVRRKHFLATLGAPASMSNVDLVHLFSRLELARDDAFQQHEELLQIAKESVHGGDNVESSVLREMELATEAELNQENEMKWTGHPPDRALLVALLKRYLKESISCHEEELKRKRQVAEQLQEEIKRLRSVVHQERQLIQSFQAEARARVDLRNESTSRQLQKAKEELKSGKSERKRIIQQLTTFLGDNFQQLDEESLRKYSTSCRCQLPEPIDRLKSMSAILEVLLNHSLTNQGDPWILIDETFWPPYIELLERYGVIVYHQDNCNMIRLENT